MNSHSTQRSLKHFLNVEYAENVRNSHVVTNVNFVTSLITVLLCPCWLLFGTTRLLLDACCCVEHGSYWHFGLIF